MIMSIMKIKLTETKVYNMMKENTKRDYDRTSCTYKKLFAVMLRSAHHNAENMSCDMFLRSTKIYSLFLINILNVITMICCIIIKEVFCHRNVCSYRLVALLESHVERRLVSTTMLPLLLEAIRTRGIPACLSLTRLDIFRLVSCMKPPFQFLYFLIRLKLCLMYSVQLCTFFIVCW